MDSDQLVDNRALRLAEECGKLQVLLLKQIRYGVESPEILEAIVNVKEECIEMKKVLPKPEFEYMVSETIGWYNRSTKRDRMEFIETPFDRLAVFNSTLGKMIRDRFNLFHYGYTSKKVNGVEVSPEHPDNVSMRVLEEVWRRLHNES